MSKISTILLLLIIKLAQACNEGNSAPKDRCNGVQCNADDQCYSRVCSEEKCVPTFSLPLVVFFVIGIVAFIIVVIIFVCIKKRRERLQFLQRSQSYIYSGVAIGS